MRKRLQTNSLEVLTKHQKRIQLLVKRSIDYRPTFHVNQSYKPPSKSTFLQKREKANSLNLERNLQMIERIESTGPKINTRKFPKISPTQKYKYERNINASRASLSVRYDKIKDVYRHKEEIVEENVEIIRKIESIGPKIQCWTANKSLKLNEAIQKRKYDEQHSLRMKFKEISFEFHKLHHISKKSPRGSDKDSLKSFNTSNTLLII